MPDPGPADTVFSPATRQAQARFGSDRLMARKGFPTAINDELAAFIAERDSLYVATASAAGQPYVQHRGGPPGFLRVLGPTRLAYADFRGNQQYITTGNLSENPLCQLFLMDYLEQQRVKLWGRAHFSADAGLIARLMPDAYPARPLQAFVFDLACWDGNCTSHIPRKIDAIAVAKRIAVLKARIAGLEQETFDLHARLLRQDRAKTDKTKQD